MFFSKEDIDKVLSRSEDGLLEIIGEFGELRRSGASYTTVCPHCGRPHGLNITPSKKVFKCFACGEVSGKTPKDYLMTGKGMSFTEAVEYLARHYGILMNEEVKPQKAKKASGKKESFCDRMLRESGLSAKEINAHYYDRSENATSFQGPTFKKGTVDSFGNIDTNGDDAIIYYYDLDGFPVTYTPTAAAAKGSTEQKQYFRVRWQFPDEHKDKNGRAAKYKSPYGASSQIYIPERIRAKYKEGAVIERLFIQEGEKKAEKASMHGLPSLGISGIQNFGTKGVLPEEVAKVVERCAVHDVVFLLDSDCFDLTNNIKVNDPVDRRPRNFFYAVKNFKDYMAMLINRGIYVETYFGYVKKNPKNNKGIDDLLADTLKGREELLQKDIETAIHNGKNLSGEYVQLHKISTMTDSKLMEIWSLQSAAQFCEKYKDQLEVLPEFMFGKSRFRYEDGRLVSAQPVEPEERFWKEETRVTKAGNTETTYKFCYEGSIMFLKNRGFGKHSLMTMKEGEFMRYFVRLNNKVVETVDCEYIRDYVKEFTRAHLKMDILELLHSGGAQYLGPFQLSSLLEMPLTFEKAQRGVQYLYFGETYWCVTAQGIETKPYSQLPHYIWAEQKHDFSPTVLPDLFRVQKDAEGNFSYQITETGRRCHFLQFLQNTSNFTWKKEQLLRERNGQAGDDITISQEEVRENIQHFIAKLCAIGYMATSFKDPSTAKIVIAVDGEQSEVGASNGRTGKSLLGELMSRVVPTEPIPGKTADPIKDPFIWDGISEKTRLVFIDDIRINFNMEMVFPNVTNSWMVNHKQGKRVMLPFASSPKIFVTTNHTVSGFGSSYADRTWNIAFSDWYNDKRKPKDDFGHLFFVEWDHEQWNLVWNLVAQCIKLYFTLGVVQSPGEKIELRKLRQEMGENFILWADEYYSSMEHINVRLPRKNVFESLIQYIGPSSIKYYTPTKFKRCIEAYCKFKGLLFNPSKFDPLTGKPLSYRKDGSPDTYDKTNGIEYYTVAEPDAKVVGVPDAPAVQEIEDDYLEKLL